MAQARTNPWLVLLVLTTGFFMIMLDTTIVNVAIPAMSTGLNTTLDQILWVLNAYVLVYAVLLITYIDWRWIFYINVPIGIAALIATFLVIPDIRPGRRHGWDVVGIVVATAGLFAIVFGLIEGERYNWGQIGSYPVSIPEVIGGGVVLMILFL